jgi:hypothetical protein
MEFANHGYSTTGLGTGRGIYLILPNQSMSLDVMALKFNQQGRSTGRMIEEGNTRPMYYISLCLE